MTTHPLRLTRGHDLKDSLDQLVLTEGWPAAIVLTGIGSLSTAAIRFANQETTELLTGPFEILSLAGTLSPHGSHLHTLLSDRHGNTCGGHLKPGSIIHTTAEIVLGILPDWQFQRTPDPGTGHLELRITRPDSPSAG